MESATVVEWFVAEGDTVEEGQTLLEVETDKTSVDVPSPASGVVLALTAEEGAEVLVGGTLGYIGEPGEPVPAAVEPANVAPKESGTRPSSAPDAEPAVDVDLSGATDRVKASPAARRRAKELGVNLEGVAGSGPRGRILPSDVQSAEDTQGEPLPASRRRIAEKMAEASDVTASVTLTRLTDASRLIAERQAADKPVGVLDLVIAPTAQVLSTRDDVNVTFLDGQLCQADAVSIGVAVQAESVLVVPVIKAADQLGLPELAARRRELTNRALNGELHPAELCTMRRGKLAQINAAFGAHQAVQPFEHRYRPSERNPVGVQYGVFPDHNPLEAEVMRPMTHRLQAQHRKPCVALQQTFEYRAGGSAGIGRSAVLDDQIRGGASLEMHKNHRQTDSRRAGVLDRNVNRIGRHDGTRNMHEHRLSAERLVEREKLVLADVVRPALVELATFLEQRTVLFHEAAAGFV